MSPALGRLAMAALDNNQLGKVRGGFDTGSGLVVNFSFQETTYVNHNLVQSIVVPTVTFSPGSATGAAAAANVNGSASGAASIGNLTAQLLANSSSQALQSTLNNGLTSVASSLGGGGFTNTVSNAADNQLVQQAITANIDIAGLSQTIQRDMASTITSRLANANLRFP